MDTTEKYNIKGTEVFISWNNKDKDVALECDKYLKESGFTPFLSENGYGYGRLKDLYNNIDLCSAFIIILTKNTLGSAWCLSEYVEAYEHHGANLILPLKIDDPAAYLDVEEVNGRKNVFRPVLYKDNPKQEIILGDSYKTTNEVVYKALYALYNSITSLFITRQIINKDPIINVISDILLNALLMNLFKEPEVFDVARIYENYKKIKFDNIDNLYISRRLVDDDKNEYIEEELEEVIKSGENLLITADGGVGKTQLIKKMKNHINQVDGYASLFIKCRQLSFSDKSIYKYILDDLKESLVLKIDENNLNGLLLKKHVVIFLDGYDEIVSPVDREEFVEKLDTFKKLYPATTFVITSRINVSDGNYYSFKHYRLNSFDEKDIPLYVEKLYTNIKEEDDNPLDDIFNELGKVEMELKRNPLYLSQLVFLYKFDKKIPNTQYEILKETSSYIIGMDKKRKLYQSGEYQDDMLIMINRLLPYLAYHAVYEKELDVISNYFDGVKHPYITYEKVDNFLSIRGIVVNDKETNLLPSFIDYYASEYIYSTFFESGRYTDSFVQFLVKHHDKNELLEMLLMKVDYELHRRNYDQDCLACFVDVLINQNVDPILLFDAASKCYLRNDIIHSALYSALRYHFKKKSNYYHELFYILKHSRLESELDKLMPRLLIDEDIDKDVLISFYRDYRFIIMMERKVKNIKGEALSIIQKHILSNPSYRNTLNSVFYCVDVPYLDTYLQKENKRIHPFFFNLYCVLEDDESDMMGSTILDIPFEDELHIYEHNLKEGEECIGLLSMDYDRKKVERELKNNNDDKVIGIIFNNSPEISFSIIPIYKNDISVLLLPSSITSLKTHSIDIYGKNDEHSVIYIEYGIQELKEYDGYHCFKNFYMPSSVKVLKSGYQRRNNHYTIENIYFSNSITEVREPIIDDATVTGDIKLPKKLTYLSLLAFSSVECNFLYLPKTIIDFDVVSHEGKIRFIYIPKGVKLKKKLKRGLLSDYQPLYIFEGNGRNHLDNNADDIFADEEDFAGEYDYLIDEHAHFAVDYVANVKKEDAVVSGDFLYIRRNNGLILFRDIKENMHLDEIVTIPSSILIDEEEAPVYSAYLDTLLNAKLIYLPNHEVSFLHSNKELEFEDLSNKRLAHYGQSIVIGHYDISSELFLRANSICGINNVYKDEIIIIDNIIYYIRNEEAHVGGIVPYEGWSYDIKEKIHVNEKYYPVTVIDKNVFNSRLEDCYDFGDEVYKIKEDGIKVFVPFSVRIIEKQEYLEDDFYTFSFTTDASIIPDGWNINHEYFEQFFEEYGGDSSEDDLNYHVYNNGCYLVDSYSTATFIGVQSGVKEITVPSHIVIEGKEYEVDEIEIIEDNPYVKEEVTMELHKMVLPSSIRFFNFPNAMFSKLEFNEYEGGLYLGTNDNPYYVLAFNKCRESESLTIHKDTKIINLIDGSFNKIYLPKSVSFVNSIANTREYSLFYEGDMAACLRIGSKEGLFRNVLHLYTFDKGGKYVEIRDLYVPCFSKRLRHHIFEGVKAFDSITLKEGFEIVSSRSFVDCYAKTIVLPKTIKSIYSDAFAKLDYYIGIEKNRKKPIRKILFNGTLEQLLNIHNGRSYQLYQYNDELYYLKNKKYVKLEDIHLPSWMTSLHDTPLIGLRSVHTIYFPSTFNGYDETFKRIINGSNELDVLVFKDGDIETLDRIIDNIWSSYHRVEYQSPIVIIQKNTKAFAIKRYYYVISKQDVIYNDSFGHYILHDNRAIFIRPRRDAKESVIPNEILYQGKTYIIDEIGPNAFSCYRIPNHLVLSDNISRFGFDNRFIFSSMKLNKDENNIKYIPSNNNPYFMLALDDDLPYSLLSLRDETRFVLVNDKLPETLHTIVSMNCNFKGLAYYGDVPFVPLTIVKLGEPLVDSVYASYYGINDKESLITSENKNALYIIQDDEAVLIYASTGGLNYCEVPLEVSYKGETYPVHKVDVNAFRDLDDGVVIKWIGDNAPIIDEKALFNLELYFAGSESFIDSARKYSQIRYIGEDSLFISGNFIFVADHHEKRLEFINTLSNKGDEIDLTKDYYINGERYYLDTINCGVLWHNYHVVHLASSVTSLLSTYCEEFIDIYYHGSISGWLKINITYEFNEFYLSFPQFKIHLLDQEGNFYKLYEQKIIHLDEGVNNISEYIFSSLSNLHEMHLPKSIETISDGAFQKCKRLRKIIFDKESHVISLGERLFMGCNKLEEVHLPNNIDYIHPDCFTGSGLKQIDIPLHLQGTLNNVEKEIVDNDIVHVTFLDYVEDGGFDEGEI